MKASFKSKHIVKREDLDTLGHVNNLVYLKWVQHIAYKHWIELVDADIRSKYVWVVIRHEIDYLEQALLGDEITLHTWIEHTSGAKSIRMVQMHCGNKLLAQSTSTFCLLDARTKRPKRVGEDLLKLFHPKK